MPAPIPSSKLYVVHSVSVWRKLGLASLMAAGLLSACGGGGGGGSSGSASSSDGTGVSNVTYSGDFPIGMALASPAALADSSALIAGGLGITDPGLNMSKTLQQGVWASQADAVATGRLDIATSGLLSVSALFDTSIPGNASCYGPAVAYANHDDTPGTSGTLAAGQVALWLDTDAASPPLSCGASELNARVGNQTAQIQQAVLLASALHHLVETAPNHQVPTTSTPLDLTSRASTLLTPLLSGVTVNSASAGMSSDGTEYTYRIVLTRGSGTSAQSLEVNLLHTPTETSLRYYGVLQITMAYLTSDASLGCTDQMSTGLYKTARLTSLDYNRQYDLLSVRNRSGQYCGNPSLTSSSNMAELATLSLYGELDPTVYLSGTSRGSTLGWRQHFASWTDDISLSSLTSDFIYIWQTQPDGSTGSRARMFAGSGTLDTGTQSRTLALYHGYTDDISTTDGTLQGMLCNDHGPGSTNTVQPLFQYQSVSLGSSASNWAFGTSHIRYAPTNSCNAVSMTFDANGDGSISSGEGTGNNDLMGLTSTHTDVQEEITSMGFLAPSLLP